MGVDLDRMKSKKLRRKRCYCGGNLRESKYFGFFGGLTFSFLFTFLAFLYYLSFFYISMLFPIILFHFYINKNRRKDIVGGVILFVDVGALMVVV